MAVVTWWQGSQGVAIGFGIVLQGLSQLLSSAFWPSSNSSGQSLV